MSVWSMNFSMMIGLAVGIDYSLFIVSRYREERARGQGRDRRDREHDVDRGQGRLPLRAHRRAVARRRVPRAGDGVPLDGPRHDPVGRRGRPCRAHAPARGARRARRQGPRDAGQARTPTSSPRAAGPAGPASRSAVPVPCSRSGSCCSACSSLPALGMRLGMPGARVVDTGRTSRDGYELVVKAFGPGAAAPAFITVPAADASTVVKVAAADPERRRRPGGHRTGRDGSRRGARHPEDPGRRRRNRVDGRSAPYRARRRGARAPRSEAPRRRTRT